MARKKKEAETGMPESLDEIQTAVTEGDSTEPSVTTADASTATDSGEAQPKPAKKRGRKPGSKNRTKVDIAAAPPQVQNIMRKMLGMALAMPGEIMAKVKGDESYSCTQAEKDELGSAFEYYLGARLPSMIDKYGPEVALLGTVATIYTPRALMMMRPPAQPELPFTEVPPTSQNVPDEAVPERRFAAGGN